MKAIIRFSAALVCRFSAALVCLTAILHSPISLAAPNEHAYEHTGNAAAHNNENAEHSPVFGDIVTSVPEADTYAMMLSGLGLVAYVVYRRRSR